jgi:hypothetical protein
MSKQKRRIPGNKKYAQPFSYAFFLEATRRANPHPGRFPNFTVAGVTLYGWFGFVRPMRQATGLHPAYRIGGWVYEMTPFRVAK